jgi:LysM repeat protein
VASGDSLAAIAAQFGVSQQALAAANNITNPNVIEVGQVLVIPAP